MSQERVSLCKWGVCVFLCLRWLTRYFRQLLHSGYSMQWNLKHRNTTPLIITRGQPWLSTPSENSGAAARTQIAARPCSGEGLHATREAAPFAVCSGHGRRPFLAKAHARRNAEDEATVACQKGGNMHPTFDSAAGSREIPVFFGILPYLILRVT